MELLVSILIIVVAALFLFWAADKFVSQYAYPVKLVVGAIAFILILQKLWPVLKSGHLSQLAGPLLA